MIDILRVENSVLMLSSMISDWFGYLETSRRNEQQRMWILHYERTPDASETNWFRSNDKRSRLFEVLARHSFPGRVAFALDPRHRTRLATFVRYLAP
jgi:hypothetical protein